MAKKIAPNRDSEEWQLTEHVTRFVNETFGRRLRPSRALYDAIHAAIESGYSPQEIRLVFWVARCIAGDLWMKEALSRDLPPEIALRHKGATNPKTGNPARRHLDELLARASETNAVMVSRILQKLPEDMRDSETALLKEMEVPLDG